MRRSHTWAAFLAAIVFLSPFQLSAIVVDGDFSPGEWNPAIELRAVNSNVPWGPNNDLITLYVSWDVANLYIGVEGYSSSNNVFFIYIDSSTRSTGSEQTDYYPGLNTQTEGWDPDFVHAVVEMENGIGADVRRIQGSGSTVSVGGSVHASREAYQNSNGIGGWEMSIPWSAAGTETSGWIKVAAGIGWATDKHDTEAPLGGASGDELGEDLDADNWSLDNPVQIFYDENGDGIPDAIGSNVDSVVVRFEYQAPVAAQANLAGDFNDWCNPSGGSIDTGIDAMAGPDTNGIWMIDRKLLPGYYEYKFVTNGNQWHTDPLNPDMNPADNNNSVLIVYDPLVYYVLPIDGGAVATPFPDISARIAKSESTSFDWNELKIYIDETLAASGVSLYDAAGGKVYWTVADSLHDGQHEVKMSVANHLGWSHADSAIFYVDSDFEPPVIQHIPLVDQPANNPVLVNAIITDNKTVTGATLSYNETGGPVLETPFYEGTENNWYAEIPASFVTAGKDIEYTIEARDMVNETVAPDSGSYGFSIRTDNSPPVIGDHFASPQVISPGSDGVDDVARLSFYLSETADVDMEIRTSIGGTLVKRLLQGEPYDAGYRSALWDGSDSLGTAVPDGDYIYRVTCVDNAGLTSNTAEGDIAVSASAPAGKLKVALLFHANQTLNYQGDTANDVCFNGLLRVLRGHPDSKFMLHFSGSLLHDLLWYDFRHSPSTIEMLRAGAADGQFEIVGSTYAQNIPYSTHMWDNDAQVKAQREVIERSLGVSPVSFWNAERCWKQQLVPLIADNAYNSTWVESHILSNSGTTVPLHSARKTSLGEDELIIFSDDIGFAWKLNGAIDSGNTGDLISYLSGLHSQDTYRDFLVCYCEDAEATGLWDYENGSNPQWNWDNLDAILNELESLDWIELTTFSEYLAGQRPIEKLMPIVDGQATWMVGPSQSAGWADWFDFNKNSPLLAFYRDFFDDIRDRVEPLVSGNFPGTPAGKLAAHALRNFVGHQFEFGCIGCGDYYCQDYHKMETVEAVCRAIEYAASPVSSPQVLFEDANGDSIQDVLLVTRHDFFIFSPHGGRLLYWYDLEEGEQIVGNEIFMWGFYYTGWREHFAGGDYNDDYHYMVDIDWSAPYEYPAAQPYQRSYAIRKKCFTEFFSIGGSPVDNLINDEYGVSVESDTIRFSMSTPDFIFEKSFYPAQDGLGVTYSIENLRSYALQLDHRIENSFNPSLIEVMDYGRGSLKYYDGSDTSSVVGPLTIGVINTVNNSRVEYDFSPAPDQLSGRSNLFALQLDPEYSYSLAAEQTKIYHFTLSARRDETGGAQGSLVPPAYDLRQNYPNPFNPITHINYSVAMKGPVKIKIYDVTGRSIRSLVDKEHEPGGYSIDWDGSNDAGTAVGSGVYFCRMISGDYSRAIKLVLIR
jgi:flagellar hook assembly protein FlgD